MIVCCVLALIREGGEKIALGLSLWRTVVLGGSYKSGERICLSNESLCQIKIVIKWGKSS